MYGIQRHRSVAMMAILSGAATALAQPSGPSFHRLSPPSDFDDSKALGVSTNGVVVGELVRDNPSSTYFTQGYRWTASAGFELMPIPTGQKRTEAVAISDDGQSVLGRGAGVGTGTHLIWRGGETIRLRLPAGARSIWETVAISGDGQIVVGAIRDESSVTRGMRWDSAGTPWPMSDFPVEPGEDSNIRARAVNLDGTVIAGLGWMDPGPWYHAFRWTEAEDYQMLGVIPGFPESHATDMSEDGSVIVGFGNQGFHQTAFRWTAASGFQELGYLPGGSSASVATGISGDGGVIVGRSGVIQPFIWDQRNGMRNLREIAADLLGGDPTAAFSTMRPTGISADGYTIVGYGENEFGRNEGWVLTLPGSACYADCDESGALDFFDFLCYQNLFAAGAPEADCDGTGELDFFDFLCFQNAFAAGCP